MNKEILPLWLGRIPYEESESTQTHWHQWVQNPDNPGVLLALEHDPVITLGIRSTGHEDLLVSEDTLQDKGFNLRRAQRGGEATLHAPGQLVLYPIFPLRRWQLGVREYVDQLIEVTRSYLHIEGIIAEKSGREPGLYTNKGKIAFFGVRVSHGVSQHGLSLNVSNDVEHFKMIVSCGKKDDVFDRMATYGSYPLSEVARCWLNTWIEKSPQPSWFVRPWEDRSA